MRRPPPLRWKDELLERNCEIVTLKEAAGQSYRQIGKQFDISYERVRQIVAEMRRIREWWIREGESARQGD